MRTWIEVLIENRERSCPRVGQSRQKPRPIRLAILYEDGIFTHLEQQEQEQQQHGRVPGTLLLLLRPWNLFRPWPAWQVISMSWKKETGARTPQPPRPCWQQQQLHKVIETCSSSSCWINETQSRTTGAGENLCLVSG